MWKIILAQLRFRGGRSLATACAVAAAVTSFALLTSAARGSQVRETGTVKSDYRPVYDILVRPANAAGGDLVAPSSTAGTTGGIALSQWKKILATPDVSVAAPVALVGYVIETGEVRIDVRKYLKPGGGSQVLRINPTWVSDDGLTRTAEGPIYFYATDQKLNAIPLDVRTSMQGVGCQYVGLPSVDAPQKAAQYSTLMCWSSNSSSTIVNGLDPTPDDPYLTLDFYFPMEIAAVDPIQEEKLDGLGGAVTSGRYLTESESPDAYSFSDQYSNLRIPKLPVLASSLPETSESLSLQVEQVPGSTAVRDATDENVVNAVNALNPLGGVPAGTMNVSNGSAYRQLLGSLNSDANPEESGLGEQVNPEVVDYFTTDPVIQTGNGKTREQVGTQGGNLDWGMTQPGPQNIEYNAVPPEASDTAVQGLVRYAAGANEDTPDPLPANEVYQIAPVLHAVGEFDPRKIDLGTGLSSMPGDWMQAPNATVSGTGSGSGSNSAADALFGKPLAPDDNPVGPVSQSPTLITTLSSLPALENPQIYTSGGSGGINTAAPISDIRVRVSGTVGMDELSKARVLAVADAIHRETGLRVDIVDGSSPTTVTVAAPAGRSGRPALDLAESWVQEGVATAVVTALDRKTVALAIMVLIACALAVGNAVSAAVRTRVTELGVLACVGWGRRRLFALVLGEALVTGIAAGGAGALAALALAPILHVHLEFGSALLAVPAALALTLIAALAPAWRATHADPGAAVRPAVLASVRRVRPRGIGGLAVGNLLRVPGRTLLGALSLAIGVAACTALTVIQLDFHGQVTGSVLGDAVTVQVEGVDYLAAAIIVLLGALSVADVLYVDIRERSAEFALLSATGWSDGWLARLAVYEAVGMGIVGSLLGAGLGLSAAGFAGAVPPTVYATAALVAFVGILLTAAAAFVPAMMLRRLPTAQLLAEE